LRLPCGKPLTRLRGSKIIIKPQRREEREGFLYFHIKLKQEISSLKQENSGLKREIPRMK
jgi:hypothetical protein